MSRFSSPGIPKTCSTPSFSSAETSSSAPFIRYLLLVVLACNGGNNGRLEASGNCFGKLARGCVATDVGCSYGVLVESGLDGCAQAIRRLSPLDMFEHQAGSQQQRDWIGNSFSGNVRRGSVHRLENRCVLADIRARREAEPADQS